VNTFTDLLVQKRCFGCNLIGEYFCAKCRSEFHPKYLNLQGKVLLRTISQQNPAMMRAVSGWKDRHLVCLTQKFADFLIAAEPQLQSDTKIQIVTPPQRSRASATRGFNPMAQLALEIKRRNSNIVFDAQAVFYKREPKDQRGLNLQERVENVVGAFGVNELSDLPIIVLDDVWTTGSTVMQLVKAIANPEQVSRILVLSTAYRLTSKYVWKSCIT